ncbi:MAG: phosphatidate cytidylyltransferase [Clostridia bacterium]|nr:phosphatidate cytidylyltransferase [Clostridia bacterium]
MKIKRILSVVIGFPIVALILIFGNTHVINVLFSIIAIIAMYEYLKSFTKENKPVEWVAYLSCLIIAFLGVIPKEYLLQTLGLSLTIIVALLFIQVIVTNMKTSISDIMITLFGICYITLFLLFMPLLYKIQNGNFLIWFILIAAWGTDTCAYIVGIKFGKHKFTKISPKKSIEGCIGGTIGAIIIGLIYTIALNIFADLQISYIYIILITGFLSILAQIGDLSASSIKRTVNIKDFGNLIPGHGGILDRIDSVIFIAPFAYFLLQLI